MKSFAFFIAFILGHLFAQCLGQVKVCRKNLTGEFTDIVVNPDGSCLLDSVTAELVTVNIGANLTVKGISAIKEINPLDGTIITLKNRTQVGTISVTESASTTITAEKTSFVKSLVLSKAGATRIQGPFGTIDSDMSGRLDIFFSTVRGDIQVRRGSGPIRICGSEIKNRTTILSRFGGITFGNNTRRCSGSKFERVIRIERGSGSVILQSANARGVTISNRKADVSLSLSSLGRIVVSDISGDLSLMTSTAKRGASLTNIAGSLTIMGAGFLEEVVVNEATRRKVGITTIKESSFQKSEGSVRLSVIRRGRLSISSANFFKGSVRVIRSGPVVFNGNGDVNVTFVRARRVVMFENNVGNVGLTECAGGVELSRNVVRNAIVDSCTGGISLVQNVFRTLRCFRNVPAPVGKENSISRKATGQCAKFQG